MEEGQARTGQTFPGVSFNRPGEGLYVPKSYDKNGVANLKYHSTGTKVERCRPQRQLRHNGSTRSEPCTMYLYNNYVMITHYSGGKKFEGI